MYPVNIDHGQRVTDRMNPLFDLPIGVDIRPDPEIERLLAFLSPATSWGDRQTAVRKIGNLRISEALPGLLEALPYDPFWMVRCSIIQALEMIGDPVAIPTLRKVATNDSYQVVRSYATKAIKRLTRGIRTS